MREAPGQTKAACPQCNWIGPVAEMLVGCKWLDKPAFLASRFQTGLLVGEVEIEAIAAEVERERRAAAVAAQPPVPVDQPPPFEPGQRVRPTALAIKSMKLPRAPTRRDWAGMEGEYLGRSKHLVGSGLRSCLRVRWDGRRQARHWHPDYIEPVVAAPEERRADPQSFSFEFEPPPPLPDPPAPVVAPAAAKEEPAAAAPHPGDEQRRARRLAAEAAAIEASRKAAHRRATEAAQQRTERETVERPRPAPAALPRRVNPQVNRQPAALLHCEVCGVHIGSRKPGEPPICLKPRCEEQYQEIVIPATAKEPHHVPGMR